MVASTRPPRSQTDLERAAKYVSYEYCQALRQLDRLATSALAEDHVDRGHFDENREERVPESDIDAHIRMHLVAFRNLVGFFADRPRSDDVAASDFIPDIDAMYEVDEPSSLRGYTYHFNKRAGHLTYQRGQGTAYWEPIAGAHWLVTEMSRFIELLAWYDERDGTTRAQWFVETHAYAEQVLELFTNEWAEAFFETPTGAVFMKQWTLHPTISFSPPPVRDGPERVTPPRFSSLWRSQRDDTNG